MFTSRQGNKAPPDQNLNAYLDRETTPDQKLFSPPD